MNSKKIYILCPAYTKTGGTELMHQLCYILNKNNIEATMVYYANWLTKHRNKGKTYRAPAFDVYSNYYLELKDLKDNQDSIILAPEVATGMLKKFKKAKKYLWWLSVDNFTNYVGLKNNYKLIGLKQTILKILTNDIYKLKNIKTFDKHFCQSYYAIDYLKHQGIKGEYLSDYLNEIYLNSKHDYTSKNKKENVVLYNPSKGYEYTKKIIDNSPQFEWIPLVNLSNQQVKELLESSKLYIDFGNHPGKDRFPREAAISGCCIITCKNGAAKFYEDVMIEDEFKFDATDDNINLIISKMNDCINNYDKEIKKIKDYRNKILNEKIEFEKDAMRIFTYNNKKGVK